MAPTLSLAGSGVMGATGTGTLAPTVAISRSGTKDAAGSGSLALVPAMAAAGVAVPLSVDATGTGTLDLAAAMAATGTKATSGTGVLVLVPTFSSSTAPVVVGRGSGLPTQRRTAPVRRHGEGHIAVHAVLWAVGSKSFEVDDELVLALAA